MKTIQKVVLTLAATSIIGADAHAGRWLSRDPIEDGAGFVQRDPRPQPDFSVVQGQPNLYAFVGNDGINNVDLLGLLNVIRLGFKGAGGTEGRPGQTWLLNLSSEQRFGSQSVMQALWYIFKKLDTNKDGVINDCDEDADIRVTGYSWGGWSAVQLAKLVNDTTVIRSHGNKHRWMRVGLLDPVSTARDVPGRTTDTLTPNVYFALNFYQQNGCFGRRCPGPSSWYKGRPINGAANIDVTTDRPPSPLPDGVPLNMTPDHVHMMENYHGYALTVGLTLWYIPWP